MGRIALAAVLLCAASGAQAATATDFGVRLLDVAAGKPVAQPVALATDVKTRIDLGAVTRLGGQWGRVTSTYRSVARNRRVGGVANSYHLSGRAIDIARRAGVSHGQIVAAYRNAGYSLVEALDEGDHTHIAFGTPRSDAPRPQMVLKDVAGETQWRIVYAPGGAINARR